jgi:serine/threonine protein kinase
MTAISVCPDEPELLPVATGEPAGEAVERHLVACEGCRGRVERLRAELMALRRDLGSEAARPDAAREREGEPAGGWTADLPMEAARDLAAIWPERPVAIGKYIVVEVLGWGGEADVYRVIHPNLGKEMVLKLARHPVAGEERASLVDEVRALVELEHINLVRVYDSGFHDDRPYLVMEYVHGSNLEDYARDGSVTPRRAAELVARLARALSLVHQRRIVHRDIKPRNILIDETGAPRLIDFGLARLRNAWSEPFASTWGGTLAYMAPEQARREHERIGPRSDIFGLGAVLFFLLTGRAPFVGKTQDEIWDRARRCEFEAGALRNAKVSRRLERICLKALAADPEKRYSSAEALDKALRRYLVRPRIIGGMAACGLILIGTLGVAREWLRPAPISSQSSQASIQGVPQVERALTAELTIRVWSNEPGGKQGLRIDEPGALPLLPGEKVHIEARLNQPAHAYLLWLDGQGQVSVLHPRDDGRFGSRPSGDLPRETFQSPAAMDEGHRMTGPGGLETVLLLARRTPLPSGTDLAGLVGAKLPPAVIRNDRGIDAEADKIGDPLPQMMERLRAQWPFDVIAAKRFAYRGE